MSIPNSQQNPMTNAQLLTLACLISSGGISSDEYLTWAEKKIIEADRPPYWILQLVSESDPQKAVEIILQEARYVMVGRWHILEWGGLNMALLFLRHRRNLISWKEFLSGAIRIASVKPSPWSANDFQRFYDAYLDNDENPSISYNQAERVGEVLAEELLELSSLAESFPLADCIARKGRQDNAN
jgi:hypothetical protein